MIDREYNVGLYRLIKSGKSDQDLLEWKRLSGNKYSNSVIKFTLKKAGREDLIPYMIQEENISMGDIIKSRSTARVGKVIGIHHDGDTITVKWDTGGSQYLSKESVFKIKGSGTDPVEQVDEIKKVFTESDPYAGMSEDNYYPKVEK